MKKILISLLLACSATYGSSETVNVDFESIPASNSISFFSSYTEDGYTFMPSTQDPDALVVWGTNIAPSYQSKAMLINGDFVTLSRTDNHTFSFISIDLASAYLENNPFNIKSYNPFNVTFSGLLPNNSTVSQTVTVNNPSVFSTFMLSGFNNVLSVTWRQGFSIVDFKESNIHQFDNLVLSTEATTTAVPEPETYAMFLAGLGLMGFVARRKK